MSAIGRYKRNWRLSIEIYSFNVLSFCVLLLCKMFSLFFFSIMGVLSNKCGFQLQYQMIFSVWLLAFSPQMCEHLRRYNIIPVLSDILQESVKEKVTRIILAAFRVSAQWRRLLLLLVCVCVCVEFFAVNYFWKVGSVVSEWNVWIVNTCREVYFGYIQMEKVPCYSACYRTTGVFHSGSIF